VYELRLKRQSHRLIVVKTYSYRSMEPYVGRLSHKQCLMQSFGSLKGQSHEILPPILGPDHRNWTI